MDWMELLFPFPSADGLAQILGHTHPTSSGLSHSTPVLESRHISQPSCASSLSCCFPSGAGLPEAPERYFRGQNSETLKWSTEQQPVPSPQPSPL